MIPGRQPALHVQRTVQQNTHSGQTGAKTLQAKFRGDPQRHCYIDEDTGDEYDVYGQWETFRLLIRRRDQLRVKIALHTNEPIEETLESRAARLNQTSRTSMELFGAKALSLDKRSQDDIYDLYSEFRQPNPLPTSQFNPYLKSLSSIDKLSSPLVSSYPQREDDHDSRVTTTETILENPRQRARKRILADFYRAEGSGEKSKSPTLARISLRLSPQRAMEVWLFISSQLVGGNQYVKTAKIAGPSAINTRSDSVIIYLSTNDEKIAAEIAKVLFNTFGKDCFIPGVPFGMKELAPGIGYAERHPDYSSHGESRAAALELALEAFDNHLDRLAGQGFVLDEQTQINLFRKSFLPWALQKLGISAKEPHQNSSDDTYI